MNKRLIQFTCLLAMGVSACSPQVPSAATEPAEPEGQAFTSERFGYSFSFPAGWIIKDKPGEWADYDPLDPNRTGGIDAFAGYVDNRNLTIGIGARELAEGITLESWIGTAKSLIKAGVSKGVCYEGSENDPVSEEEFTLDGEPAVLLIYECPNSHDSFGLVVLAIHDQRSYWITWISPQGHAEADKAEFTQVLSTFSFTE